MRYFGVDYSKKKIGLALGDDVSYIAVPFELIPGGPDAVSRVVKMAKNEGIDAFVVGLPIPTDAHQKHDQLERTAAFANELLKVSGLPVHVVDEQFSSAEARRVQADYGATASEDELAAMLILQAYFDQQTRTERD